MPASDIQLHKRDAELLYLRGLQYARDGNRGEAATALRQAISLNPLHEQAWLRLSDTLDDPHEVAFCLQVALQDQSPERAGAARHRLAAAPYACRSKSIFSSLACSTVTGGAGRLVACVAQSTTRLGVVAPYTTYHSNPAAR